MREEGKDKGWSSGKDWSDTYEICSTDKALSKTKGFTVNQKLGGGKEWKMRFTRYGTSFKLKLLGRLAVM
jgi:hypothetical protein